MIRLATQSDSTAIEEFLRQNSETSMFLRGNLAAHGTDDRAHRHGTTFYLQERDGEICAVGGVTNGGYVMCQTAPIQDGFHAAFAAALRGRTLAGMTGAEDEVRQVFDALGCQTGPFSLRAVEPLYAVETEKLEVPSDQAMQMRRPQTEDAPWLGEWFSGFYKETGVMPMGDADGYETAKNFCAHPDAQLMTLANHPVAMSTFNARAHESVQIGGVYVPPEHRGRGYGGGIVARHLLAEREKGIQKAILFAASGFAAHAYEAIGFQLIGSYELALFQDPGRCHNDVF
ncbi:MAG: GNAT family N-acetyltransferase [Sulfitobacter sp.]